jgi:CheY-like chemotaxis protein
VADGAVKKILVVDDEVYLREILAFDLEQQGYEVLQAESGRTALELVKTTPLDLVISDVRMPSGNGVELLRWIKQWSPHSPPFLFMTAFSDISADEALDLGATGFLTKPLDREEILALVADAVVPRETRWRSPAPTLGVRSIRFDGEFALESDEARDVVLFGSGGLFLGLDGDFPATHEIVSFDVPFGAEPSDRLLGHGLVRWVRHERTLDRLAGIGVEIRGLASASYDRFLRHLVEAAPASYIPLGVAS